MDQAGRRLLAKCADHPFHFAPAAEVDDVAEVAAAAGAPPRFGDRMLAEMLNKLRGLGKRAAAGSVNVVTQNTPRPVLCRRC